MSASEDRKAIATTICDECCARPGDPCLSCNRPHRPIQDVHVVRVLAYRNAQKKPEVTA